MVTLRIFEKRLFGKVTRYEGQFADVESAMRMHLNFYESPNAKYSYEIITIHAAGGKY